jgi:hypothetical protein
VAIRTTNFEILPAILPIDDVTLISAAEVSSSEDTRKLRQPSYRGAFILLDLNQFTITQQPMSFLLLLLSVGPAESHRAHCSLSRLIMLNPAFSSPVHFQRCSMSERRERPLLAKGEIMGEKWPTKFNLTNTTSAHL